jgi:hypothetical protein
LGLAGSGVAGEGWILMGADSAKVVSRDSPANPEALDWLVALAGDPA